METTISNNFWRLAKWNFLFNLGSIKRNYLILTAIMVGFLMLINQLSLVTDEGRRETFAPFFFMVLGIGFIFSSAEVERMRNKNQGFRTIQLLPATKLQKFTVLYVEAVLAVVITAFASLLTVDAIQALVTAIKGTVEVGSLTVTGFDKIEWDVDINDGIYSLMFVATWLATVNVLGVSLLRKKSTVMTVLFMISLGFLVFYIFVKITESLNGTQFAHEYVLDQTATGYLTYAIIACLTVANVIAAYFFFKRTQMNNSKWFNV